MKRKKTLLVLFAILAAISTVTAVILYTIMLPAHVEVKEMLLYVYEEDGVTPCEEIEFGTVYKGGTVTYTIIVKYGDGTTQQTVESQSSAPTLSTTTSSNSITVFLDGTTVSVDPPSVKDSGLTPDATFTVDINITDVEDLFAWGTRIGWDADLLDVTIVEEGPFLKGQPMGSGFTKVINNVEGYVDMGCTTIGEYAGVSGSGILVTITFLVEDVGECVLDMYGSSLLNYSLDEILHTAEDGYFSNILVTEVGWIEGAVTDADTTLPIEGATVTADGYSDATDASGHYSLEVSPGTYDVTAEMAGYVSQTATVTVAADETVTQDFALEPTTMPPIRLILDHDLPPEVGELTWNYTDTLQYGDSVPIKLTLTVNSDAPEGDVDFTVWIKAQEKK